MEYTWYYNINGSVQIYEGRIGLFRIVEHSTKEEAMNFNPRAYLLGFGQHARHVKKICKAYIEYDRAEEFFDSIGEMIPILGEFGHTNSELSDFFN